MSLRLVGRWWRAALVPGYDDIGLRWRWFGVIPRTGRRFERCGPPSGTVRAGPFLHHGWVERDGPLWSWPTWWRLLIAAPLFRDLNRGRSNKDLSDHPNWRWRILLWCCPACQAGWGAWTTRPASVQLMPFLMNRDDGRRIDGDDVHRCWLHSSALKHVGCKQCKVYVVSFFVKEKNELLVERIKASVAMTIKDRVTCYRSITNAVLLMPLLEGADSR